MKRGRIAALAVATAVVCAGIVGVPLPAEAQVPTDHKILAGNFYAGPRDEFFYYTPGAGPDEMYTITKVNGEPQFNSVGSFTINGTYTPLVGDFDGDGFDEILWYAPGFAPDFMWNFTSYSSVQSRSYPVNGVYSRPTVGDYTGDGADDILWYAPGFTQDWLWDYNRGGSYNSGPRTINGHYLPVSGSFGNDRTDDVFWYAPGTAADYLWDYVPGSTAYQSVAQSVNATTYRPFSLDVYNDGPGSEDIYWYAPGTSPDFYWDYFLGSRFTHALAGELAINGHYLTAAGDFFGGGADDIVFESGSDLLIREHLLTPDGSLEIVDWTFVPAAPSDARVAPEAGPTGVMPSSPGQMSESAITRR